MDVLEMKQIVEEVLVGHGWTLFDGPALATKMYDTAVGQKQAEAWFPDQPRNDDSDVVLSGAYQSEGRNILSTSNELISIHATADKARTQAMNFCERVEKVISKSYAVKLL